MYIVSDQTAINVLNMVNDPRFKDILRILHIDETKLPDEINYICIKYFKGRCFAGISCNYSHNPIDALYTLEAYVKYF